MDENPYKAPQTETQVHRARYWATAWLFLGILAFLVGVTIWNR